MDKKNFAARFRDIMEQGGFNQQEFAEALGVTQPAVSNYLKGRIPPAEVLLRISRITHVSIEWLLSGQEYSSVRVSEPSTDYHTGIHLKTKIDLLDVEFQRAIESLVDRLLKYQNQR